MLDSGGGGGGSAVGSLSGLIAAAAAKAELMHLGWTEEGDYRLSRSFETDGSPSDPVHAQARVEVDTYSGQYTTECVGPGASISKDNWVEQATGVVKKWGPKIDDLFTRWRDLPSRYTSGPLVAWGAKELNFDPTNPTSVSDDAGSVNSRLAGDLERLRSRARELTGQYAKMFADYYVNDLGTTIQAQDRLLAALAVASTAQGEVWGRAEHDLLTFQQDALKAMESSGPAGGPDSGVVLGLTIVGALAAALAAVPTLGGSTALFGVISAGAVIGAGVEGAKKAKTDFADLPLGASHPDQVFTHMDDALKRLNREIRTQEQGIQDFLVKFKRFADSGACELARPELNSAPAGEVLSPHQPLTVDKRAIAEITELWLPSVAGDLRQAERYLVITVNDGFHRGTDVGVAPDGAWTEYDALQSRASQLLTSTAADLEGAADKLEQAARLIGMTDDQISDHYRGIEKQVEDRNLNDTDDVRPLL
ncbi:hypothetical protein GCM10022237_44880 [Nocardioides ginsengisoli]|uniref:WXG100 family type VII secretion target n=1 Tax=Nocardioides ginsengisoli TaxID=363868 RepID=A0ABW3VX24_9ACTN